MKKSVVKNALNELPKEFALDELMERLIVIEKIEEGLKDEREGRTISHEQAAKEIKKWRK
ncbi:MAG: hypothetical protein WCL14_00825 [Bacteroidota bacterium]